MVLLFDDPDVLAPALLAQAAGGALVSLMDVVIVGMAWRRRILDRHACVWLHRWPA